MPDSAVVGSRSIFSNERPAYSIYPPAVIRHVVFRLTADENPSLEIDEGLKSQKTADLCRCLAAHVNSVRDSFGPCMPPIEVVSNPGESDEGNFKYSLRRSILVEVEKSHAHGYRLRVRVDAYAELFTITYLIDRIDLEHNGALQQQMRRLPRDSDDIDQLFDDVWSFPDFRPAASVRDWTTHRAHENCARELGEPIADFRSILLFPRPKWHMEEPSLEFGKIAVSDETQMAPEILAFASEHQDLIHRVAGTSSGDASGEAVVCGMAGGQALYVAELGQWGVTAHAITPVRLLLVYAGHSHTQLGRLMRRLHVLGELRHAAVLDWNLGPGRRGKDLSHANVKLRELSKRVDDATLSPSMEAIRENLVQLAEVSIATDGGLNYRVEQSRAYAGSYLKMVPHLRIIRLAGWQTYDDFVNRYVFQLFGRIDRVGRLYEALGRRVDRLMLYEQAKGVQRYQGDVSHALFELRDLISRLAATNDRQEKLLGNAEYFAIVFLIYYVGSIYAESVKDDQNFLNFLGISAQMNHSVWFLLAAAFAVPITCYLIYKIVFKVLIDISKGVRRMFRSGGEEEA